MNRRELRDLAGFVLSFNDAQVEGDFSETRLNKAIDWAYEQRWNYVRQHVSKSFLIESTDFTWDSGEITMDLPTELQNKSLYKFMQVLSDDTEIELTLSFRSRNVLSWPGGPTDEQTVRAYYISNAEKLLTDEQSPVLIPPEHHQLIAWDAAILLKLIADQEVPSRWISMQDDLAMTLVKDLISRPLADYARISPLDVDDGWLVGTV